MYGFRVIVQEIGQEVGIEELNSEALMNYFRPCYHREEILLKKQRMEILKAVGYERIKSGCIYQNCNQRVYGIVTSMEKYESRTYSTCCLRIFFQLDKWMPKCRIISLRSLRHLIHPIKWTQFRYLSVVCHIQRISLFITMLDISIKKHAIPEIKDEKFNYT